MTMMTPITSTAATAIRHPESDRAERLAACASVVGEMLAEAALALDMAAAMPPDRRFGSYVQAHMRMVGAVMFLSELCDQNEDAFRVIRMEIICSLDTPDADLIRDIAVRLDAAFGMELHSISIGIAYDRYA